MTQKDLAATWLLIACAGVNSFSQLVMRWGGRSARAATPGTALEWLHASRWWLVGLGISWLAQMGTQQVGYAGTNPVVRAARFRGGGKGSRAGSLGAVQRSGVFASVASFTFAQSAGKKLIQPLR